MNLEQITGTISITVLSQDKGQYVCQISSSLGEIFPQSRELSTMEKLTERQAFEAMVLFLESLYERTNSDEVGGLLSDLLMSEDGTTADPAAWDDWMECVQKVLAIKQGVG